MMADLVGPARGDGVAIGQVHNRWRGTVNGAACSHRDRDGRSRGTDRKRGPGLMKLDDPRWWFREPVVEVPQLAPRSDRLILPGRGLGDDGLEEAPLEHGRDLISEVGNVVGAGVDLIGDIDT